MICSLNDLKVYKEYYDNILNGNIVSFNKELVDKLNTHKNIEHKNMSSYLKTILTYSEATSYLKCRYLHQFMSSEYVICDGRLNSFDQKIYHSWIESNDKVYDTIFLGVWPKELYYKVMNPTIIKKVDSKKDEEYLRLKSKTIETEPTNQEFGYYDWYNYMKNNTINTRSIVEPLRLKKFKNE